MSEFPVLSPDDQRILGSLLEKQTTVPASYPLTAHALMAACNQTSSRDPVVDYDEQFVERTAHDLKARGLVRIVWSDTGRRTLKYHQTLDEHLGLDPAQRALMTVLLLRGAQAPGELRTRTERLHPFPDRSDVEDCLQAMAARTPPLVRELERQPGQKDRRWIHLLGPVPTAAAVVAAPAAVDLEVVVADGPEARDARIRTSYDTVAAAYADQLADELAGLPFERWLLDRVIAHADGRPVVDVGAGPGHGTAYLVGGGADASGIDLSPAMVAQARARYPQGRFEVGDLRRLMRPVGSGGWAAVIARHSLIHLAPSELPEAIGALARPLAPGGWLVLGLYAGPEARRVEEWFGLEVDLDFVLHDPAHVLAVAEAAGLVDVEWYVRGRSAAHGESAENLYLIGRRPEEPSPHPA